MLAYKNTPEPDYTYIYTKLKLDYIEAIHGGLDTTWNFSEIINLDTTISYFYTKDPGFNSFPGYTYLYCEPPDPADTTFLYSPWVIYKVTDEFFNKAYVKRFAWYIGYIIDDVNWSVFTFPFELNSYVDMGSYSCPGNPGTDGQTIWKIADAYGNLILGDSIKTNLLRTYTYYDYYFQISNHDYDYFRNQTYEWYADNSEMPLLKIQFRKYTNFYMYPHFDCDTVAYILTSKVFSPFTSIDNNFESGNTEIVVFPCPAKDMIYITVTKPVKKLELFNSQGVLIKKIPEITFLDVHEPLSVNFTKMDRGIYILKGNFDDGKTFCKKLIIR